MGVSSCESFRPAGRGSPASSGFSRSFAGEAAAGADVVLANYYLTAYPAVVSWLLHRRRAALAYNVRGYEPWSHGLMAPAGRWGRYARFALAWLSYRLPLTKLVTTDWLRRMIGDREAIVVGHGIDLEVFRPEATHPSPVQGDALTPALARARERERTPSPPPSPAHGRGSTSPRPLSRARERDSRRSGRVRAPPARRRHRTSWRRQGLPGFSRRRSPAAARSRRANSCRARRPVPIPDRYPAEAVEARTEAEMAAFYRRCDVFVFPSLAEGFGLRRSRRWLRAVPWSRPTVAASRPSPAPKTTA